MTCAPSAAASRANCSCLSSIDALSPVQVVCVIAARITVTVHVPFKAGFVIILFEHFSRVSDCDVRVNKSRGVNERPHRSGCGEQEDSGGNCGCCFAPD